MGISCDFINWVSHADIRDLDFRGPAFTWQHGSLFERFDRVLCNEEWHHYLLEASLFHLPRISSDHRPLLMHLYYPSQALSNVHPFKFQATWLTHESFKQFVKDNWRQRECFMRTVASITEDLQIWNKEIFGHILKQNKVMLARIKGIQRSLEKIFSSNLYELEIRLKKELEIILQREEIH